MTTKKYTGIEKNILKSFSEQNQLLIGVNRQKKSIAEHAPHTPGFSKKAGAAILLSGTLTGASTCLVFLHILMEDAGLGLHSRL